MPYAVGRAVVHRPTNDAGQMIRGRKVAPSFEQVLRQTERREIRESNNQIKFSAHAIERMRAHGIRMDAVLKQKLKEGFDLARSKGISESLVVTDDVSFIVSVPNSAVITMVPRGSPQGDVFTKIDGAVIV